MWLYGSQLTRPTASSNTFTGQLVRNVGPVFSTTPWNASAVHPTVVGTATFAFTDSSNGTFTYTVDGVTQTKAITRFVFASPTTRCR